MSTRPRKPGERGDHRPSTIQAATARIAALVFALTIALAGAAAPWSGGVAAADTLTLTPSADAWINRVKPDVNYGTASSLRAAGGEAQAVLKFATAPWVGFAVERLTLTIDGLTGSATPLIVDATSGGWTERSVTWRNRPAATLKLSDSPAVDGVTASFDVSALFSGGTIDREVVSMRITSASATTVRFGSRESALKPRLVLVRRDQPQVTAFDVIADSWADSTAKSSSHGSSRRLYVDAQPRAEAFLKFDMSGVRNRTYSKLDLKVRVGTSGGRGIIVYRVSPDWSESTLTWAQRPTGGTVIAQPAVKPLAGTLTIDVSRAFVGTFVNDDVLALRVVTTNSRGFDFSSREGRAPPRLAMSASTPTPSPTSTPTPVPTAPTATPPTPMPTPPPTVTATTTPSTSPSSLPSATACPTVSPPPSATPSSVPSPTASPTPSQSPAPSPSPTPMEPLFYFDGFGTDHGAGMSQQGARGRAAAGQTYDQILTFYYTGVAFTAIDGSTTIRVKLSDSFWPTPTVPARVTAITGGFTTETFPGRVFPAGSYVEMWPSVSSPSPTPTCAEPNPTPSPSTSPQTWAARVFDPTGVLVATATTGDLTVSAVDANGVLEMRYRDDAPKYKQYRGSLRLLVTPTGLDTINALPVESYLRGVVPAEVPATWPLEAVKAQAVAARTYAWSRLKGAAREWDVLPTSANQVYGGYQHEHPRSDQAIAATSNLVLTYEGKVISALYHTCAGGHTENSEYAFVNDRGDPGNVVPYLRGKPDVDENGVPYDVTAGPYSWKSGEFTMSQLSAAMNSNLMTAVGDLYNVTFSRGVSGRVYRVVLEGSLGTKTVSGGKFKNTFNSYPAIGTNLKSTLFYLTDVPAV